MERLEFSPVGICPVCLSPDSVCVEIAKSFGHRLDYRACSVCGLVRLDPRPTAAAIGRFYETFYMGAGRDIESTRSKQRDFAYFMLSALASSVRLDDVHTVLDLGCGYGETLAVIAKALANYSAVRLYGIEPSEAARALAQEVCQLVGRSHDDLRNSTSQYDLIIMSHVLEHMPDPVQTLQLLKTKLTPAGTIALEVPNYFCHPSTDIVHNYLFTPDSLKNVIVTAGLDLISLHRSDHASSARPAYLTAIVKPGAGGSITRVLPLQVLEARRTAMRQWPGFTKPGRLKAIARRLLGAN